MYAKEKWSSSDEYGGEEKIENETKRKNRIDKTIKKSILYPFNSDLPICCSRKMKESHRDDIAMVAWKRVGEYFFFCIYIGALLAMSGKSL